MLVSNSLQSFILESSWFSLGVSLWGKIRHVYLTTNLALKLKNMFSPSQRLAARQVTTSLLLILQKKCVAVPKVVLLSVHQGYEIKNSAKIDGAIFCSSCKHCSVKTEHKTRPPGLCITSNVLLKSPHLCVLFPRQRSGRRPSPACRARRAPRPASSSSVASKCT